MVVMPVILGVGCHRRQFADTGRAERGPLMSFLTPLHHRHHPAQQLQNSRPRTEALGGDLFAMREFMDYVHGAFYAATGWNRGNSYATLNETPDGVLQSCSSRRDGGDIGYDS